MDTDNHSPRSGEARGLSHVQSGNGDLTLELLRRKGEAALDDGRAANIRAWQVEVKALEGGGMAGTTEHREAKEILASLIEAQREWMTTPATSNGHGPGVLVQPEGDRLHHLTPEELDGDGEAAFEAVIPDLAFNGLKTLIVGLSKAGKSWLVWARVAAACREGKTVLYLSEEPRKTLTDKLDRFGLRPAFESGALKIVGRWQADVFALPWDEVAVRITREASEVDLVVVDTLRPWVRFEGDESNNGDAVGAAMDRLTPTCGSGAAVVVIHQSPWEGKRARNSTELHAASDLIFHVEGEGSGPRTIRYIGGRIPDVPNVQTFRWSERGAEDLGPLRRDRLEGAHELLEFMDQAGRPLMVAEMADGIDRSEKTVRRYLELLEPRWLVVRESGGPLQGRGGSPDRWRRPGRFTGALVDGQFEED